MDPVELALLLSEVDPDEVNEDVYVWLREVETVDEIENETEDVGVELIVILAEVLRVDEIDKLAEVEGLVVTEVDKEVEGD